MVIKYADDAMFAARTSLANDLEAFCEEFDIDATEVMDAVNVESRPVTQSIDSAIDDNPSSVPATAGESEKSPERLLELIDEHVDVAGERVAVLGLTVGGDDEEYNSRTIPVIEGLQSRGADVVGYDATGAEHMREQFPEIEYADSTADAIKSTSIAAVVTDWDQFIRLDGQVIRFTE